MIKYIETDKLKQMVEHKMDMQDTYLPAHFFDIVDDIPAADVVSQGVVDQIKWERDMAISQLEEVGKGLGSKMDDVAEVVRCRDCKHYHAGMLCEKWADLHPHAESYPIVGRDGYCHYGERRDD